MMHPLRDVHSTSLYGVSSSGGLIGLLTNAVYRLRLSRLMNDYLNFTTLPRALDDG